MPALLKVAIDFDLYWVECALPENLDDLSPLSEFRVAARELGVLLAGAENGLSEEYFDAFVSANAYDVIKLDVKYDGGIESMLSIAKLAHNHNVSFSPTIHPVRLPTWRRCMSQMSPPI